MQTHPQKNGTQANLIYWCSHVECFCGSDFVYLTIGNSFVSVPIAHMRSARGHPHCHRAVIKCTREQV